ncbi:glycosyltransferase family 4 protein [Pseudoxanthomonas dokdonensis]|uniref:glycosyltransferase family 4 protein n=1 Tax=Pseudoxanthomonas dokdonensis TaxID=344882 RepID=UPI0009F9CE03|nr:glycosyltransferase family 4 protein [Pseudoxanthomonas dokdonensis]
MQSKTRPLHVLMVLEAAYPAWKGGGAEAQVRTLSRGLRRRGHRVTVVVPRLRWGPQETLSRLDGVPVYRLSYPRVPMLSGPLMWLALALFLWRRRDKYDAWHVHIAHHMAAVCAVLGKALDQRVLTKVSGWWELEKGTLAPRPKPLNRLARLLLGSTAQWQAISQRIAATLVERGIAADRIVLLPNAVNSERFAHIQHPPEAATRFVFIGRLEPEKDLMMLMEAFAETARAHPDAQLLLVGSGSLDGPLRERARAFGIEAQVVFAGHRDDIEAMLAQANVGVLCSRIEGLSNTLLESMAAGLPMVASRISGNEDFIRDGENGWLFDAGNCAQLAQCLRRAADTDGRQRQQMGENARRSVHQRAGLDTILTRLLALYAGKPVALTPSPVPKQSY